MRRASTQLTAILSLAMLSAIGCSESKQPANHGAGANPPAGQNPAAAETSDKQEKVIAEALAKLPDADRAVAEAQRICPISRARLGSMDTPIKVSLNGQDVYLCCEGCKKEAEANPTDTLAKLKK